MKNLKIIFSIIALFSINSLLAFSDSLNSKTTSKVLDSVYEIVVDKIEFDSIEYEKELPWDKVPYAIRNDKYIPIGTAFRLDNGKFYTAAHVLRMYGESIYKNFYIRDSGSKIYKIDIIESFSTDRDFVSFSVPEYKAKKGSGLKTSTSIDVNTSVFSVGNALGEGIIIRDGIYTSQTPESKDGAWNWIRFSAAASPGNSGGPLIKKDGSVVGIITMKSANENLNYALPISEVLNFPKNKGVVNARVGYRMPNLLDQFFPDEFKMEVELPQSHSKLQETITDEYKKKIKEIVAGIRKDFAPDGTKGIGQEPGKEERMMLSLKVNFPVVFYRGEDGQWSSGSPAKVNKYQLEDNGYVECGGAMNSIFAQIRKPDSLKMEDLISNPKLYMSYIVKAASYYRSFGNENIRVTSLGEPVKSETYKDYFGRTWQVNYFNFISDSMFVSYSIPIPGGIFVLAQVASTGSIIASNYLDVEFLLDNMALSYEATVKEWKEYLSLPEKYLSRTAEFDKTFAMSAEKDKFTFSTNTISADVPASVIELDEKSSVSVGMGFEKDRNSSKLKYVVNLLGVYRDPKSENYVYFTMRELKKPGKTALEETQKFWNQIVEKVAPYDAVPINDGQYSMIIKVLPSEKAETVKVLSVVMSCKNDLDVIKNFEPKIESCLK